jgi:hypothetical protein
MARAAPARLGPEKDQAAPPSIGSPQLLHRMLTLFDDREYQLVDGSAADERPDPEL